MNISRNEHTIADCCEVSGRGYWTGQEVRVVMSPASVGTGIELIRTDLPDQPSCLATVANRHDAQLRTVIKNGTARFEMIEHLMAALYALEIDNCRVEVSGEEFPGLDGSSSPYVDALRHAGLIVQAKQRQRLVIDQTLRIELADRWIQAGPLPADKAANGDCYFEYQLSFDSDVPIKPQTFGFSCTPSRFALQVATARTFVTQSQAETLRAQGVAGHVTNQDLLIFGNDGPIDNPLRFANECARHKTLDLIGDLALTGFDIVGQVTSFRGGHNLNGQLARKLSELAVTKSARTGIDPSQSRRAA